MEACNTMMMILPLALYLLKDSVDIREMSQNEYLNIILLSVGLILNRENFQGMVYVMFVFYMIQALSIHAIERKNMMREESGKESFTPGESVNGGSVTEEVVVAEEKEPENSKTIFNGMFASNVDEVVGVDDSSFGNFEEF